MRACSAGSSLGRLTCRAVKRTKPANIPLGDLAGAEPPATPSSSSAMSSLQSRRGGLINKQINRAGGYGPGIMRRARRPSVRTIAGGALHAICLPTPVSRRKATAGAALAAAGKQLDTAVHIPYPRHDRRQRLPPFCPAHCSGSIIGSGWERRISKLRLCVG